VLAKCRDAQQPTDVASTEEVASLTAELDGLKEELREK
jgi:hypothetical protein